MPVLLSRFLQSVFKREATAVFCRSLILELLALLSQALDLGRIFALTFAEYLQLLFHFGQVVREAGE
jgi:hypothetical protein